MDTQYGDTLLEELSKLGLRTMTLAKLSGLRSSELRQTENIIKYIGSALSVVGDVGLGLNFGRRLNVPAHGTIGYALMTSATAGDLLRVLTHYHRLLTPNIKVSLRDDGDLVALHATAGGGLPEHVERFFMESFFASVHTCASFLFPGSEKVGVQAFSFREPHYIGLYRDIFHNKLVFSAQESEYLLPRASMSVPLQMANPAAEVIFRQQCDVRLSEYDQDKHVSSRVMQEFYLRQGDFPLATEVASALHMSESTLRRRLQAEDTTYQRLLDSVRSQLAREYLTSTELPVAEVARLVGFDDVTNFRRSFRRWTGRTPSSYRTGPS